MKNRNSRFQILYKITPLKIHIMIVNKSLHKFFICRTKIINYLKYVEKNL